MKFLKRILFSPFLLSLPITILILFLIPDVFEKYKLEIIDSASTKSSSHELYYYDLDCDGNSELIEINVSPAVKHPFIIIKEKRNGLTYEQINFDGSWSPKDKIMFGDFDNNQRAEIYAFTVENDTLCLNIYEFDQPKSNLLQKKTIIKLPRKNDNLDAWLYKGVCADLNNDGFNEIIFTVFGGYSVEPRFLYAYDIRNDSLIHSRNAASVIATRIKVSENDSAIEITGASPATGNVKEQNIILADTNAWFIVYDQHLDYKFSPVKYLGNPSGCVSFQLQKGDSMFYLVKFVNGNIKGGGSIVDLYNYDGTYNRNLFKSSNEVNIFNLDHYYILDDNNVFQLTSDLKLKWINTSSYSYAPISRDIDVDNDGINELLCYSSDNQSISVYDNGFRSVTQAYCDSKITGNPILTVGRLNGKDFISLQVGNTWWMLDYHKNRFYGFKYPFYIGIYLLLSLFVYIIQFIQKKQLQQKYNLEHQIAQLQFNTVKDNYNPHFAFNILNSVSL